MIAFEDLKASSMIRGLNNAESKSDAGWGIVRQFTEYKQRNRGQRHVEVPTKNGVQECSRCHKLAVPLLELSDRKFRSTARSHVMDRGNNAAKIVVARALAMVGSGRPEYALVETGTPPAPSRGRRVQSRKQELP